MSTPLKPTGTGNSPSSPPADPQPTGAAHPLSALPAQEDHRTLASRRAFPRIPCRVLVDYVIDGRAYRDCIANISESGAFIETSRSLPPGKPITLSFSLFQDQQPIKVTGEVAWSSGTGIGVKLRSNPGIRQFCAEEVAALDAPPESTLQSLDADEPDEEEPDAGENAVPVFAAPHVPLARQAPHPRQPATARRPLSIPAALPVWAAIILVTALLLLDRTQTNSRILALSDKVDRTSQTLARLEPSLAALAAQTSGPRPEAAPAVAPVSLPAPPAEPTPASTQPDAATTVDSASPAQDTVYVVEKGDTLYRISVKFAVPSTTLVEYNHLADPNIVLAGQRLRIPSAKGM